MRTSESIDQVAVAFVKAKNDFQPALKTAKNPQFNSKYVDLASAVEACDAALLGNGLVVIQGAEGNVSDKSVTIVSRILHISGQWIEDELCLPAVGRGAEYTAQTVGSAITYGRRYGYMAILGIAPEDDDGNAASAHVEERKEVQRTVSIDQPVTRPAPVSRGNSITKPQASRFYAIAVGNGKTKAEINAFLGAMGCERTEDILSANYDAAIEWAGGANEKRG